MNHAELNIKCADQSTAQLQQRVAELERKPESSGAAVADCNCGSTGQFHETDCPVNVMGALTPSPGTVIGEKIRAGHQASKSVKYLPGETSETELVRVSDLARDRQQEIDALKSRVDEAEKQLDDKDADYYALGQERDQLRTRCEELLRAVGLAKCWFASKYIKDGDEAARFCVETLKAVEGGPHPVRDALIAEMQILRTRAETAERERDAIRLCYVEASEIAGPKAVKIEMELEAAVAMAVAERDEARAACHILSQALKDSGPHCDGGKTRELIEAGTAAGAALMQELTALREERAKGVAL